MNRRLPSFALLVFGLFPAWIYAETPEIDREAERLMGRVVAAARSHASISAKIRQQIDVLDQRLVGSGEYWQQGRGKEQKLRLELKIQVADETTSYQQVCDGTFLWIHQDMLSKPSLARIDLARVDDALNTERGNRQRLSAPNLALCGLPKMLEALDTCFQFRIVQESELDGVPAWILRGNWRPEQLAATFPDLKAKKAAEGQGGSASVPVGKLPAHAPEVVVLMIGRDDLFPYRIEYRRRVARDEKTPGRTELTVPLLIMEWYEVALDTQLDPRKFEYRPGNQDVSDGTDKFLQSLGLVDEVKPEAKESERERARP